MSRHQFAHLIDGKPPFVLRHFDELAECRQFFAQSIVHELPLQQRPPHADTASAPRGHRNGACQRKAPQALITTVILPGGLVNPALTPGQG